MQISRNVLLNGALATAAAGVVSAALVLLLGDGAKDSLSVVPAATPQVSATPTPEPTVTPSPAQAPAAAVTPTAVPAPKPTATPTPTRSTGPTPTGKPTQPKEVVHVTLSGPRSVVAGQSVTYTMVVTWDHERPGFMKFSFDNSLPGNDGCLRPTAAPADAGPGSTRLSMATSFSAAGNQEVSAFAQTLCQYFDGYGVDSFVVHVSAPTPTPSATPTP